MSPLPASATCSFQSIQSLPFSYDPIGGAAATAAATMTISCDASSATAVTVTLDAGTHAGPAATPWRKLMNVADGETLNYNIYLDAAHATVWGDGTSGTGVESHAQTSGTFALTLYGLIPGGQSVAAGSYSDTVTATLTF
ncbi:MAG TPA: spore coat U domain-containing protein [Candidatus Elarobacter sp.]|jgi:spore coat protein U-like protein|nr:spore coat U domain-containing protein [Candidatus Elarobacter sp.]